MAILAACAVTDPIPVGEVTTAIAEDRRTHAVAAVVHRERKTLTLGRAKEGDY